MLILIVACIVGCFYNCIVTFEKGCWVHVPSNPYWPITIDHAINHYLLLEHYINVCGTVISD